MGTISAKRFMFSSLGDKGPLGLPSTKSKFLSKFGHGIISISAYTQTTAYIIGPQVCENTMYTVLDRLHFLLTWDHGERCLTSFFRDVTHKILRVDQPRFPFQVLLCPQGQQLVQNLSGVQIARVRGTGLNNLLHPGQGMALLLLLLSDRRPILRECEMKTHLLLDAREAFLQKSDVLLA